MTSFHVWFFSLGSGCSKVVVRVEGNFRIEKLLGLRLGHLPLSTL